MAEQASEREIRQKIKNLREFYRQLTVYGAVNVCLILIWAISGAGYFWPIWVIIGWGIGLGLQAVSLGVLPVLEDIFPFFSTSWEEQQVQKALKNQKKTPTSTIVEKKTDSKSFSDK